MRFRAEINIMPMQEALDTQGKAVKLGLAQLGLKEVQDVRIGKHIMLELEAASEQEATTMVEAACKKLLANPIMEDYSYTIHEA